MANKNNLEVWAVLEKSDLHGLCPFLWSQCFRLQSPSPSRKVAVNTSLFQTEMEAGVGRGKRKSYCGAFGVQQPTNPRAPALWTGRARMRWDALKWVPGQALRLWRHLPLLLILNQSLPGAGLHPTLTLNIWKEFGNNWMQFVNKQQQHVTKHLEIDLLQNVLRDGLTVWERVDGGWLKMLPFLCSFRCGREVHDINAFKKFSLLRGKCKADRV